MEFPIILKDTVYTHRCNFLDASSHKVETLLVNQVRIKGCLDPLGKPRGNNGPVDPLGETKRELCLSNLQEVLYFPEKKQVVG